MSITKFKNNISKIIKTYDVRVVQPRVSTILSQAKSYTNTEIGKCVKISNQAFGSSTFNSSSGVTINLPKTMSNANYKVSITPTSNPNGSLGEVWVESKTTTSFIVKCSGSTTTTTFDWMIMI